MSVNLLPRTIQRRMLMRRCLRAWSLIWIAAAALVALPILHQWHGLRALQSRLQVLAAACEPLHALQTSTARLAAARDDKTQQLDLLASLQSDGRTLRLIGLLSRQRTQATEAVQVQTIAAMPLNDPPASPANTKPASKTTSAASLVPQQRPWRISMIGQARSDAAINALVGTLREANNFRRVELKSIVNGPPAEPVRRDWAIEMDYEAIR